MSALTVPLSVSDREWTCYEKDNYDVSPLDGEPAPLDHYFKPPRKWYDKWLEEGMRKSVQAVILSHEYGFPHVFVLKHKITGTYKLFGGKIRMGESERDGLLRKLRKFLIRSSESDKLHLFKLHVGEMLCQFWRPEFDEFLYPYLPPQYSRPKQSVKVYQVTVPPRGLFKVKII